MPAGAALDHPRERRAREARGRDDVHADQVLCDLRVDLREGPVAGEARVVHEQVDAVGGTGLDLGERRGVGEIGREHLDVRLQPLSKLLEPLAPARDDDDVVAVRSEPLGERDAEPR